MCQYCGQVPGISFPSRGLGTGSAGPRRAYSRMNRSERAKGGVDIIREDCYLSKRSAAKYLDISVRSINQHLAEMPHFRKGGKILFRKSELDRWMDRFRERLPDIDLLVTNVDPPARRPDDTGQLTEVTFQRLQPFLSKRERERLATKVVKKKAPQTC